jgi:hypothetical protein
LAGLLYREVSKWLVGPLYEEVSKWLAGLLYEEVSKWLARMLYKEVSKWLAGLLYEEVSKWLARLLYEEVCMVTVLYVGLYQLWFARGYQEFAGMESSVTTKVIIFNLTVHKISEQELHVNKTIAIFF